MLNIIPPRIYISAVETHSPGKPVFNDAALSLLEKLGDLGLNINWVKEFRGYEVIEQDIANSNALLAILDRTWEGST